MKKYLTIITAIVIIAALIGLGACAQNNGAIPKPGNYYLITKDGLNKSSYIRIINRVHIEFVDFDSSEYVESFFSSAKSDNVQNAILTFTDPDTGKIEECVLASASPEMIKRIKVYVAEGFKGQKNYNVEKVDGVDVINLDNDSLMYISYQSKSDTITIGKQSFKLVREVRKTCRLNACAN